MLQSSGIYCDACRKPITTQKNVKITCLPACEIIMHNHDNNACESFVDNKAAMHCNILNALSRDFISVDDAQSCLVDNLKSYI